MKTAWNQAKNGDKREIFISAEFSRRSKNWWEYTKLTCFKYLLGYAERISIL